MGLQAEYDLRRAQRELAREVDRQVEPRPA